MAARCPRCYAELPEDARWVCPTCEYTLRMPGISKVGIAFMVLGLFLIGPFLLGPENVVPRDGSIPYDIVDLTVANFALFVLGIFALGMLLALAGALQVRGERGRAAV